MIFKIVLISWFASEILLNRLMRSSDKDKKGQDKGSLAIIWMVIAIAITAAVFIASYTSFNICSQSDICNIGLGIIVLGMLLRFFAIWSLGEYFTVDATIRENHQIKKDGLYKIIRHPSYTGSLLSFIGFGIALNNWLSLIIVFVLVLISFSYRIHIEEKMLIVQFGSEYEDYKKNTYRLIPWIY